MPRKAVATHTRKATAATKTRRTAAKAAPVEAPAKRPVGRPRKNADAPVQAPVKATRGRKATTTKAAPVETPVKRPVGRPRKNAVAPVAAAPVKATPVPAQRAAKAKTSENTYFGFTPEFLKGLRALMETNNFLIGVTETRDVADKTDDADIDDAVTKHTKDELNAKGIRELRTLAITIGFDPADVKTTDKKTLVDNIYEAEHENDDEDDDADSDVDDADEDDEDDEDSDDDSDDDDEEDDDEEDDDEDEDEDAPSARFTIDELRAMTLPNLRKVLVEDDFDMADLKGVDKDDLIAWYLEPSDEAAGDEDEDDDADEDDDDVEEDEYQREDLIAMADGELKEMARINGIKLPKGATKDQIVDLLLGDDEDE